jgi:hypothetical protein
MSAIFGKNMQHNRENTTKKKKKQEKIIGLLED